MSTDPFVSITYSSAVRKCLTTLAAKGGDGVIGEYFVGGCEDFETGASAVPFSVPAARGEGGAEILRRMANRLTRMMVSDAAGRSSAEVWVHLEVTRMRAGKPLRSRYLCTKLKVEQ